MLFTVNVTGVYAAAEPIGNTVVVVETVTGIHFDKLPIMVPVVRAMTSFPVYSAPG
jgi:hypothetical protein